MTKQPFGYLMLLSLGMLISLIVLAGEDRSDKEAAATEKRSENSPALSISQIPYIPPAPERLTPVVRVASGATRGVQAVVPTVTLLAPEHVALTVKAQPTLYWHLPEAIEKSVVHTLIPQNAAKPLLKLSIPGPVPSGIHALKLSAHGARLELGKAYEWSVSLEKNPQASFSNHRIARRFIMRTPPIAALQATTTADPLSRARAYAKAGVWYDALAVLSEELASIARQQTLHQGRLQLFEMATQRTLRQARTQLLEQVGLWPIL
ncbi:protein of unknown function DUF928 [Nitrosococcus halophilus Nc 4]|uniref:DUF928 domain-containing protein n=1 Tax=Nitrosococcus halophilus (strain Nc4) TaxID=472759 RepID=D5C2I5_NITHN|nr:DUF928 domain-containing protein [Nitrosococcus halophilus]ADE14844.1 protein of unknown function DUF928 [Nitrosococcus halophilus Nc 4]